MPPQRASARQLTLPATARERACNQAGQANGGGAVATKQKSSPPRLLAERMRPGSHRRQRFWRSVGKRSQVRSISGGGPGGRGSARARRCRGGPRGGRRVARGRHEKRGGRERS